MCSSSFPPYHQLITFALGIIVIVIIIVIVVIVVIIIIISTPKIELKSGLSSAQASPLAGLVCLP